MGKLLVVLKGQFAKHLPKSFLIGPRGAGKSATVNTIIGKNVAKSINALRRESTTKEFQSYLVENRNWVLIDTPALSGSVLKELKRRFAQNDVIAFVIAAQRLQKEEVSCIEMFLKDMKTFHLRTFIVLTRGNNLKSISNIFIPENSFELYNLYEAVGKKWAVFENRNQTSHENARCIENFWSVSHEVGSVKINLSEETKLHSSGIVTVSVPYFNSLTRLRVFLIGPRRAGKSATINAIIGENVADSGKATKKIKIYSVGNQNRDLADTPALDESVLMELRRIFSFAKADVIAFVISAQRLQTEEMSCIQMFLRDMITFHNRSFILLTRGNSPVNNTSVTFDPERSPELYCLYEAVGKRWVAFDKENSDNFDKFWTISQEIIYKENCLWLEGT
uniref:GTPase IMAP family member 8-like n=1 Tax=Crassostrea virginica TaxID=6565 RepID=A0A8B8CNI7_CRAVI|nr:GTPase IMAP family member 8-like [Crassostrea virginica]